MRVSARVGGPSRLVQRPRPLREQRVHLVEDRQQILRVHPRVFQHVRRERPLAPVRELVRFVRFHAAERLEEVREAVGAQLQGAARAARVEEVQHVYPKVPLEPHDV